MDRFFDALEASDVPLHRCRMTAYVDSDDRSLLAHVTERALRLPIPGLTTHFSDWKSVPNCVDDRSAVLLRRARHAIMRIESAYMADFTCSYALLLEDDTLIPPDAYKRLSNAMRTGYDWVCGFEVGRWSKRVPGLWHITGKRPLILASAKPRHGVEQVEATGLYCVLTRPQVYCSVEWDVYDNLFGHDTSLTYQMHLKGHRLAAAWDVRCVHMTEFGDLSCDTFELVRKNRAAFSPTLFSGDYTI